MAVVVYTNLSTTGGHVLDCFYSVLTCGVSWPCCWVLRVALGSAEPSKCSHHLLPLIETPFSVLCVGIDF